MAENKSTGDKPVERHKTKKPYVVGIITILIIGFGFTICVDSSSSGSAGATPAELEKVRTETSSRIIRIEVDPERWSEWVSIPSGYRWRINRPNCWEQYWFWSEKEPRPRVGAGAREWYGKIPEANFRLRGTQGTVEVIIEPK